MKYIYVEDNKKYLLNISVSEPMCDLTETRKLYRAINLLKSKRFEIDTKEHKYVASKISFFRNELQEHAYNVFKIKMTLGKLSKVFLYRDYPSPTTIKECVKEFILSIQGRRKQSKVMKVEDIEFNGIDYKLVGGVFTKPNSIIELQTLSNGLSRIKKAKKPHPKILDNYIGVELELISSKSKDELNALFVAHKLAGNVYIKEDSSIKEENDSEHTHEVTILCKQFDRVNIITRVCTVLNEVGCYVNNSCGMHVHFDARNRNAQLMYRNLVKMLPLLSKLVPANRIEGSHARQYCAINTSYDINHSNHPFGNDNRYQAINPSSYEKYKTIEVRLHGGTTNATKIINWIDLCLFAVESTDAIESISSVANLTSMFDVSNKLVEFLNKRIELFASRRKAIDTRSDHFFINDAHVA